MSDILRWKEVKTRKPHECWGCDKEYPAGSQMVSAAYAGEGTVTGCYWCETCQEYMHRHFESGDECSQGGIYENDPDGWEAIKTEMERSNFDYIGFEINKDYHEAAQKRLEQFKAQMTIFDILGR